MMMFTRYMYVCSFWLAALDDCWLVHNDNDDNVYDVHVLDAYVDVVLVFARTLNSAKWVFAFN